MMMPPKMLMAVIIEAGNRVAAHEFRGTVHGAEERTLLLQLVAPTLRFLVIDQTSRQVGVDRHLLAGNGVKRKSGADFGDTRRTFW